MTARSVLHGTDLLSEHAHFLNITGVREGKEDLITGLGLHVSVVCVAIASDTSGEVHVLLLDGDALGVDSAEVGVFEKTNDVGLGSLLESLKGLGLEAELVVHVLSDRPDESLEGCSGEEHVDRLLIAFDLSKGDRAGLEAHLTRGFHTASSWCALFNHFRTLNLHGHLGGSLGFSSNFGLGHFCFVLKI